MTRVVVAGGGIAGAEALLALRALAGERVQLTMVAPGDDLVYRPMAVAEPFSLGHAKRFSLSALAAEAGAELVDAKLASVDEAQSRIVLSDGGRMSYDALLVAVGARAVEGVEHATTWWPEGDPELYGGLLRDLEEGYLRRLAFAIPAGAVWPLPAYELALMTARDAVAMGMDPKITVITPEAVPLGLFGPHAARALADELAEVGVRLETASVARVEPGSPLRVVLQPTVRRLEVDRVVALPEVAGPRIGGLPQTERGFIPVERGGRVRGTRCVWAAGDGIAYPVKYGGLATQQADAAAAEIARLAGAEVAEAPARLMLRGMLMTGARPRALGAVAPEGGRASREPIWQPAGKVSGRYLSPYLERMEGAGPGAAADAGAGAGAVAIEQELPAFESPEEEASAGIWPGAHGDRHFAAHFAERMREARARLEHG